MECSVSMLVVTSNVKLNALASIVSYSVVCYLAWRVCVCTSYKCVCKGHSAEFARLRIPVYTMTPNEFKDRVKGKSGCD